MNETLTLRGCFSDATFARWGRRTRVTRNRTTVPARAAALICLVRIRVFASAEGAAGCLVSDAIGQCSVVVPVMALDRLVFHNVGQTCQMHVQLNVMQRPRDT